MTDRLYYTDPYCREFDATVARRVEQRGDQRASRSTRPRSIPPPAGSRSTPARSVAARCRRGRRGGWRRSSTSSRRRHGAGLEPGEAVHGVDRLAAPVRPHAAAHRPARALGRVRPAVRRADGQLSPRRGRVHDRSGARADARRDRRGRGRSQSRRLGGPAGDDPVRDAPKRPHALPLRKEPAREGTLRLIDVEAFDLSACGGTHVARTGAIGLIAVAAWERFKGGQRLEFLCGGRAPRPVPLASRHRGGRRRSLSVLPEELPAAIERIQAETKDQKRVASVLQV